MVNPGRFSKIYWLIPAGLFLLNLILKGWFVTSRDIAIDEPFTIFYAQADFPTLAAMLKFENNPPLYFVIMHFWIAIFGISPLAVRFLPMLFSSLTAPVIFLTGKRFFTVKSGLVAALIFTFSNHQLLFSHETRVYTLFALLTSLSFYFFMNVIRDPDQRKNKIFLVLVNVLLIYAHFFGFFIILIQLLSCAVIRDLRKILKICIKIQTVALLFYLPYFPLLLNRLILSTGGTWVPQPALTDLYTMLWRYSNAPVVTVYFLLLFVAAAGIYISGRKNKLYQLTVFQKVVLVWFFFPYLFMFLVSFKVPVFLVRYLVFVSIAFYLMVAESIFFIRSRKVVISLLAGAAIFAMAFTFTPDVDNNRRMNQVVECVRTFKKGDTKVLICPQWLDLGFTYYYNPEFFKDYRNTRKHLHREGIYPVNELGEVQSSIDGNTDQVILFEEWATIVDKDNSILRYLRENYSECREMKFPEAYSVYFFSRRK